MSKVVLLLVLFLWMIRIEFAFAQKAFAVEGSVVSNHDSIEVSHATITVKGIDREFMTDGTGSFKLVLPASEKYELTVKSIGYEPLVISVRAENSKDLLLKLQRSENTIEEVVVSTGYQKLPKERATGSFEVIDTELFNRQIGTDVISRLDGIIPSILFDKRSGEENNMLMRGTATLEGRDGSRPLIVVDNFPFEGDINSINPNDVESISLLKDAAAASIWGARAGNGVLVITTKKSSFNSKWRLSATVNETVVEKPNLFYFPRMTSAEFIEVERFLFEQGAFDAVLNNAINFPVVTPVVELLDLQRKGTISETDLSERLEAYAGRDIRNDLNKYFYQPGFNQQYAVNLTGGSNHISTLFSLGYDNNRSSSVGNVTSRLNLNVQNTYRPIAGLELNVGLRYAAINNQNNSHTTIQMELGRDMYPYAKLVDGAGKPLVVERDFRNTYLAEVEGRGHLLDWRYRPYEELSLSDNSSHSKSMLLTTRVGYKILKDLLGEINYQYEYQPINEQNYYNDQTYFTRDMINRFTYVNNGNLNRAIPLGGILDRVESDMQSHNLRGQLTYGMRSGDHEVSAITGMEMRSTINKGINSRLYGYNDELLTMGIVDFVTRHPIYDDIAWPSTVVYPNSEFNRLQRFVSLYANGAYTYVGKYTLSASARRDASNIFGASTNSKWTPLWSIGAAWNISNESFYRVGFLPYMKVRGTYGYSGNVRNDLAAVTTLEYRGLNRYGRYPYAIVNNPPNPLLRWENIRTLNLGIDLGAENNVFTGSFEFYDRRATDLITGVDADPTTGFLSLQMNSAVLSNKGIDATLSSRAKMWKIHWNGDLSVSVNKNRVVKYLRETTRYSQWVGNGLSVSPIEGEPAYPLVSYRWGGLDSENGAPIGFVDGERSTDYTKINQQASIADLVFHGSALPEYFGAFRNTFSAGSLSLSANIVFRAHYFFRRETVNYLALLSPMTKVEHADYRNRWQNPGDEQYTDVPSMSYPADTWREDFYQKAETTADRGDHIRLQDIAASYSFIKNGKNTFFQSLDLNLYVRNVGILWRSNNHNLDPDVRQLPLARSWSVGLTATF